MVPMISLIAFRQLHQRHHSLGDHVGELLHEIRYLTGYDRDDAEQHEDDEHHECDVNDQHGSQTGPAVSLQERHKPFQ